MPHNPSPAPSNRHPSEATPPPNATFHAKCGQWWTGTLTSHCSGCCETFSGLAAFDAHRTGSHAKGDRHCQPPETVGLTIDENRRYRCWKQPGDGSKWWNTETLCTCGHEQDEHKPVGGCGAYNITAGRELHCRCDTFERQE